MVSSLSEGTSNEETIKAQMHCRMGYLRFEAGMVHTAMTQRIRDVPQLRGPFVELAAAGQSSDARPAAAA